MMQFYRFLKKVPIALLLLFAHPVFAHAGADAFEPANRSVDTIVPSIISFTPTSGHRGTVVTIFGTNLSGATAVRFGGTLADSFYVQSDSTIWARVGSGSSGSVSVTTPYGMPSKSGFTFISDSTITDSSRVPVVTSFSPTSARRGTFVFILGRHFTGTTAVRFGGTLSDSIAVLSDSAVWARVGNGSSGSVSVTTAFGTGSKSGFTFISDSTIIDSSRVPVVTSFSPTSARKGTFVFILGKHFTGTTAVRFGGTLSDSIAVLSDSAVWARVGNGSSGSVSVTTAFGTGSKSGFTFISDSTITDSSRVPVVTSFSPTSARRGTFVFILGKHFTGTTAVRFGGTLSDSIAVLSDTAVWARVGNGSSGSVSVITAFGTGSKSGFTFISDSTITDSSRVPVVTSFSPTSARRGTFVFILGRHFTGTTAVRFGGTLSDSIAVLSDSAVWARVGFGSSGSVSVTTAFGTGSKSGFTFISDSTIIDSSRVPVVTSFSPTSARKGTFVFILGRHFTGTTAVRFGGTLSDSIAVLSDTAVWARVGNGSSGSVSVTTAFGTGSKSGFTFISDSTITDSSRVPVVTSFSPTSARRGTWVFIFGSHFTGTTAVRFGGVLADSAVVTADSTIWALVGAGASGNVTVTTPYGTGSKSGFVFIADSARMITMAGNVGVADGALHLSLYPNPALGYSMVTHPVTNHPAQLLLIDLNGRVLKTVNVGSNVSQTKVNMGGLITGLYQIVYKDGKNTISKALIVK